MTVRRPRHTREEIAQRGAQIYDRDIRPQVENGNDGKIVAIDIESGAYELGDSIVTTSDRLLDRCPDAQIWFVRVGHPAVYRMGQRVQSISMWERSGGTVSPARWISIPPILTHSWVCRCWTDTRSMSRCERALT